MEPPIDPAQHTVSELRELLKNVDDPEAIEAMLTAEQAGEDRTTARDVIDERLETVNAAVAEERPAVQTLDTEHQTDVLTVAGPEDGRELSERLLSNLEGIQNTLEEARQSGGRHEARLRKLENEVGDLAAYTDSLEEFLDEEGTAQQVLESVQAELGSLTDDLDDLKPVARSHARSLRDHGESIADLEAELANRESALNEVADDVESLMTDFEAFSRTAAEKHEDLSGRLGEVEGALDDHAARIDGVQDEAVQLEESVDELDSGISELARDVEDQFGEAADERADIDDRIAANSDSIEANSSEVERIVEDLSDIEHTLGDTTPVDDRFQHIEAQIKELEEWRDQVRSVMAGAVGGGSSSQSESDG